jgi:hypothetical protein
MNAPVSLRALTAEPAARAGADRPYALWAFAVLLVAIAGAALVLDSSLPTQQRIDLLAHSGMFP